jgi:hypothetical protein
VCGAYLTNCLRLEGIRGYVKKVKKVESPNKNSAVFAAFVCFLPVRQGEGKKAIFCKFILDGQGQIGLFMCMGGEGRRRCRAITARK